ncbi:hypothetical protein AtubIFM57258_011138 [Aspergillus tubingensis]|nr:hypothetical protein AtubIFM57258_011138 [Aspergillus tubingensis]
MINLQLSDEVSPCEYGTVAADCYLSYEDPEFLTWNGPSILSPLTHPEDVFRYASAMLSYPVDCSEMHLTVVHKYTLESVDVLPFFLRRVECTPCNLEQCRQQICQVIRSYVRAIDHADYWIRMFVWPRDERERDTLRRSGVFSGTDPKRIH